MNLQNCIKRKRSSKKIIKSITKIKESQKEIQLDQEDDVIIEVNSSSNSSFVNIYN